MFIHKQTKVRCFLTIINIDLVNKRQEQKKHDKDGGARLSIDE